MEQLIRNLDDATAMRVLRAFSTAQSYRGDCETEWSADLRQAIAQGAGPSAATAVVSDGELAPRPFCWWPVIPITGRRYGS